MNKTRYSATEFGGNKPMNFRPSGTLISKTMTLHVRYTFWYISLPSYAQLQREMTKFKVLCRT